MGAINKQNLKNFPKGVSPSPGGKPRFYTLLKKMVKANEPAMSLSKNDLRQTIVLLFDQNLEELKRIATDPKTPSILVYLCTVIKKAIASGRIDLMKEMFASVFPSEDDSENKGVINFIVGFDLPTDEQLKAADKEGEDYEQ